MGGEQAANTLTNIKISKVNDITEGDKKNIYNEIKSIFDKQSDVKYAAARMWVDDIIMPEDTRFVIIKSLEIINSGDPIQEPRYGVFQV